jgi:hypothetical protein
LKRKKDRGVAICPAAADRFDHFLLADRRETHRRVGCPRQFKRQAEILARQRQREAGLERSARFGRSSMCNKQASILALDAEYEQAAEQLMTLHRRLPGKPAILKRLVAVFEQMRDTGRAAVFLRAYQRAVPDDPWGASKAEHFRALGLARPVTF